jgi:hypothetical protein
MTKVFKVWRKASVLLPNGEIVHSRLVFITDDGLKIFNKPGDPEHSIPVDFEATREPRTNRHHVGIDIVTPYGTAVVTPTGGCSSCGSRLAGWAPDWATRVAQWPSRAAT